MSRPDTDALLYFPFIPVLAVADAIAKRSLFMSHSLFIVPGGSPSLMVLPKRLRSGGRLARNGRRVITEMDRAFRIDPFEYLC